MPRFQTIKDKLTDGIDTIADHVPRLGAEFAFETPCPVPVADEATPTSRNRWSRPDLASAIGRDPQDPDDAAWPPATR